MKRKKIGIVGGGQLGRMLIQAGINYDFLISVLDPDPAAPCSNLTSNFTVGSLNDFDTVYQFGRGCDVVTIEIENVNTEALKKLQDEGVSVYPEPDIIALIQDKRTQKQFYLDKGFPTAPFHLTGNAADVKSQIDFLPMVQKLGRAGYDGRGVQVMRNADDLNKAFDAPGLVEKLIDFKKELAVVVARNTHGQVKAFPVVELVFHPEHNLVEYLFAPAQIERKTAEKAKTMAIDLITSMGLTGVLAVEMFLTKDEEILINEVAPRVHNSGHHTIEAGTVSQFEQHLRAITGLPLGDTEARYNAAMINLLGAPGYEGPAQYEGMDEVLAEKGVAVHLYGKAITKPFRKMGHATVVADDFAKLKSKVQFVQEKLRVIS